MLPEYHLYLISLLFVVGFPAYFAVWVRRFSRAERGRVPRPSRLVFFLFLFSTLAFLHHAITTGPFPMRARQMEAQRNLGGIYYRQFDYRREHGEYAGGPEAFEALGYQPVAQPKNYTLFCGDDFFGPAPGWLWTITHSDLVEPPSSKARVQESPKLSAGLSSLFYQLPASSSTGYTCVAVGNIDWDGWPDVWTMNDSKKLAHHPTDLWPPEPGDFPFPGFLYQNHPLLARLDPGGFYFGSVAVTVLLPMALLLALGWEEWRRRGAKNQQRGGTN